MAKTEQQHKEQHAVVSKELDEKKKLREEDREVAEAFAKVATPTPTQREVDLVRLGVKVELADDGSGPDLVATPAPVEKVVAPAGTPGNYHTRTVVAGGPGPSHPPPLHHPHEAKHAKDEDEKAKKDGDKK
jgi:hypothetical protein